MSGVRVDALDHIVFCVRDVSTTIEFYERGLGLEAREERPGKWSLHFGRNKISLQDAAASATLGSSSTTRIRTGRVSPRNLKGS